MLIPGGTRRVLGFLMKRNCIFGAEWPQLNHIQSRLWNWPTKHFAKYKIFVVAGSLINFWLKLINKNILRNICHILLNVFLISSLFFCLVRTGSFHLFLPFRMITSHQQQKTIIEEKNYFHFKKTYLDVPSHCPFN